MTYTANQVAKLLANYLDIRYTLETRGQQLPDTYVIAKPQPTKRELPLGMSPRDEHFPFMETRHARTPMDGKAKARLIEDLHVSALDIEHAWPHIADDDADLLAKYYVLHTHTLDDLLVEHGHTSRGSMHQRIQRAVKRLTHKMNKYES